MAAPVGIAILSPLVNTSARSSTDRATGFYPVGWGFESLRAHFFLTETCLVSRNSTLMALSLH